MPTAGGSRSVHHRPPASPGSPAGTTATAGGDSGGGATSGHGVSGGYDPAAPARDRRSGPDRGTRGETPTSASGPETRSGSPGSAPSSRWTRLRDLLPEASSLAVDRFELPQPAGAQLRGARSAGRRCGLIHPSRPTGQEPGRVSPVAPGRHPRRSARPGTSVADRQLRRRGEHGLSRNRRTADAPRGGRRDRLEVRTRLLHREGPDRRQDRRTLGRAGGGGLPRGECSGGVRRWRHGDQRAGHRARGAGRERMSSAPSRRLPRHLCHDHRPVRVGPAEAAVAAGLRHRSSSRWLSPSPSPTPDRTLTTSPPRPGATAMSTGSTAPKYYISGADESDAVLVVTRTGVDDDDRTGSTVALRRRPRQPGAGEDAHPGRDRRPREAVHTVLRQRRGAGRPPPRHRR